MCYHFSCWYLAYFYLFFGLLNESRHFQLFPYKTYIHIFYSYWVMAIYFERLLKTFQLLLWFQWQDCWRWRAGIVTPTSFHFNQLLFASLLLSFSRFSSFIDKFYINQRKTSPVSTIFIMTEHTVSVCPDVKTSLPKHSFKSSLFELKYVPQN